MHAQDQATAQSSIDVINLVSDDERTPVRRPRPVRSSADLEIVCESLTYTENAAGGSGRRVRNRAPLGTIDDNRTVVTTFEDATKDKDVCLTQHIERFNPVKHYVHPRPACGTFRFETESHRFCSKCYCVICEIPASRCRSWRTHSAVEL